MAPELISTAFLILVNPSHQSVSLCISAIIARQRLVKNVTTTTNTQATTETFLDSSFPVRSVSYQRKLGDQFFPELLIHIYKYRDM
jgi:hypothetical protein